MKILDTSALVRFFTKDDLQKAEYVRNLLETEDRLYIPSVVFPEIEYVLQGIYSASRRELLQSYRYLDTQQNIETEREYSHAVEIYESTSLDMADCMIVAKAIGNKAELITFDAKLFKEFGLRV